MQILKKSLFFSMLLSVAAFSAYAQMADIMGSMAVGGMQTTEGVKSVGQMNKAMRSNQFLSQLQMNVADIVTTYFGDYQQMPISSFTMGNTKTVFRTVNQGQNFEAFISPLTQDLCKSLVNARFDNLKEIRVVSHGSSKIYTSDKARGQSGLCITADALALVFQ